MPSAIPYTIFTAPDAQALLDLIDKIAEYEPIESFDLTDEEAAALNKLRMAGKFYGPLTASSSV